jgi:ribosomal protein L29
MERYSAQRRLTCAPLQTMESPSAEIKRLREENARLRFQLESQNKQIIQMVDTVQKVHLARINDAIKEAAAEANRSDVNGLSAASFLVRLPIFSVARPCAIGNSFR